MVATRSAIEGNLDECRPVTERLVKQWHSKDPCGAYYVSRQLARVGDVTRALPMLRHSVEDGFYTPSFLARDPWLDLLRGEAEFDRIVQLAQSRYDEARRAFEAAGGPRIVGLPV